jgi:folate-binding protein YgfZ
VTGPGAADYLHRMVSNDVLGLEVGGSCQALLLTPKARVIALLRLVRRGAEDFLLLTEPDLTDVVRRHLLQFRFASRAEIDLEEHESVLLLGAAPRDGLVVENEDYGVPAVEVIDGSLPEGVVEVAPGELERLRIEAGTPVQGKEIDERVLPAEAGLVERAVDLEKGCYPGQEPIARLHYRGHANRGLRVLRIHGDELPRPDAELRLGQKIVGRVTSATRSDGGVVALAYVRTEVPDDAALEVEGAIARPLD